MDKKNLRATLDTVQKLQDEIATFRRHLGTMETLAEMLIQDLEHEAETSGIDPYEVTEF